MKEKAIEICRKLNDNGFEAYFVGGCVRDMILNKEINDIDISTSANTEEIKSIFKNANYVGDNFGVCLIDGIEVATFRVEEDYKDFRHPSKIFFTRSIEGDAKRRDLTINSLYYNPITKEIKDFVGGLADLKNKKIRFVGNPEDRIKEDPIRILRAIRFSLKYGFSYDKETFDAMKKCMIFLYVSVPNERVLEELKKILILPFRAHTFYQLDEFGFFKSFIPFVNGLKNVPYNKKHHTEGNSWVHTSRVFSYINSNDWRVLLASILHDAGKYVSFEVTSSGVNNHNHEKTGTKYALQICQELKISNKDTEFICNLVLNHMKCHIFSKMNKATLKKLMNNDYFEALLELGEADVLATGYENDLSEIEYAREKYKEFLEKGSLPKPLITGNDLIKLGMKPNKDFKYILQFLFDYQIDNEIEDKEILLKLVN